MQFDTALLALVPVAPFLAAAFAPLISRFTGPVAGWVLALVPLGLFLLLIALAEPVFAGGVVSIAWGWVPAYGITLSFRLDGLALLFAGAISGIGTLILIYSGAYLKGHPHRGRFMAFMLMFMGAMLGLVLADSMPLLFTFWELTSVTSFLLIGFDHDRQAARRAAIQALVITGGGGFALLAGFVLINLATGSWDVSGAIVAGVPEAHALYGAILLLVLAGAFTKSAQLPFHFWLPNAMEAPTPVSAFLHSATMVQAGVYLLLRLTPLLGDSMAWTTALTLFGGATLLWGALGALRETDLKQMLAQSTLASLGLLVLLIGVGTETAIAAAMLYFAAHALYKAALFLVAGAIDHETGTRDLVELGGLARKMPVTFVAALLAGLSMFGAPLTAGFIAKEELYLAVTAGEPGMLVLLVVLVVGSALLSGVGLVVGLRPFLGSLGSMPKAAHEAGPSLLLGPVLLAFGGVAGALFAYQFGDLVMLPAVAATGMEASNHLTWAVNFANPVLWLSVLTWALAGLVFFQLEAIRTLLRRLASAVGFTFDRGFDVLMFGLIRFSGAVTRLLHHGRLEIYVGVLIAGFAIALFAPLLLTGTLPDWPGMPLLEPQEWAIVGVAVAGLVTVVTASTRLIAIAALGVQGFAVAALFMLFGAPDLSFTQFMVEVLSVVILALVMTRLSLDRGDPRPLEEMLRDGTLALAVGVSVTVLLFAVLAHPLDLSLTSFFGEASVPLAHGHNIVNVILVDFRGLDTLGEISVVMTAGIAMLALIRRFKPRAQPVEAEPVVTAAPRRRTRRKPVAKAEPSEGAA